MALPDFTDLATVKAWFSPPLTSATDDVLLARLITAESAFMRSWLNRDISQATYTDTLDGPGRAVVILPQYPVTAVSAVAIDGEPLPQQPAGQPLAYGWDFDDTAVFLIGAIFPRGRRRVTVTWTAGYPDTPADIAQACVELVALRYRERDRIGLVSKAMGGETTAFVQRDMPASVATILSQYKRVSPW
ncbi:hypothetical protein VPG91_11515 [Nitrospirillum amazonense]|uniref:hypothetical protein n=1 Tax=Nitrospirillum amazonense TaxID=28077 RepID=UPI002DD44620|nr:hypothetical protein [Nitrospirillum amazonense]MEC4591617.1 hypothetical protein [Nitrospirillum amazonense]